MDMIVDFYDSFLGYGDLGLFLMRLYFGSVFIYSGQKKIRNVKGFAEKNGLPVIVGLGVVLFELFGGLGVILGIFTQVAASMIIAVMLGAMYFHNFKWHTVFWAQKGGWEYDLMLTIMAIVTLTTGGGSIAILPSL